MVHLVWRRWPRSPTPSILNVHISIAVRVVYPIYFMRLINAKQRCQAETMQEEAVAQPHKDSDARDRVTSWMQNALKNAKQRCARPRL